MYTGKMCVTRKLADAVNAHKRDFPDTPITHASIPKAESDDVRDMFMQGHVRVDGVALELTDSIIAPPGHVWVGHVQHD